MTTHVLLSLDVEKKASDEKREKLYEKLKAASWVKRAGVSTTWWAKYDSADVALVAEDAMAEVRKPAGAAGVAFHAVMHVGNSAPVSFGPLQLVVRRD